MEKLSTGHRLKPLLMSDMIDLAEKAWQWRHDAAAASIRAADLDPEAKLRVIDQVDQMRGTIVPLSRWMQTFEGAAAIVLASLRRAHVDKPESVIEEASSKELSEAAIYLVTGITPKTVRGGSDEADPTKGRTGSTSTEANA